jgi:predicted ATPase/class 3 adenylate cyclase
MSSELEQLRAGIEALEAQRTLLGNAVADAALGPLRARLSVVTAARLAEDQALRQVTILFLDVVGSTTLSQHLDPEDVHAVLGSVLAQSTAVVVGHGGKVLRYAGDNLLAAFGADVSREDDAERAVRAGLALIEEGRLQGELVERRYGHRGLTVRVGLHTGTVLFRAGVTADDGVHGIAVSIAARMEQTAPAGFLRISRDTYRHVRGLFDVQPQPAMSVKGLDQPFFTYLVLRAKQPAFRLRERGVEGLSTRMIGRDEEFARLQDAFAALRSEGNLTTILVMGEAGVGKSRLLHEFETWSQTQPNPHVTLRGRASQQSQPYSLLRAILSAWLGLVDTDSIEVTRQKIVQSIAPMLASEAGEEGAEAHAHLLGHLIGFDFADGKYVKNIGDDPRQLRDRGFHAASLLFRQIATREQASILLLLEDLQWADDGSLEFLAYLSRANADLPMLVLAASRPALFERVGPWPGHADMLRIELSALHRDASSKLAFELLKKLPEVPVALETLLIDGAEGNPFYMEELVNMLIDKGAIEAGEEHWRLHSEELVATPVPQTLTGVVQARLDALPAPERRALQEASVIGFVFWEQALSAIDPQASWSLPALVQRALTLQRQDPTLEGMREYVFRHQILHHVTYDTVVKRTRRELHAKVAAWLEGIGDVRQAGLLGVTAKHHELAGQLDRAAEFYARAAEHARERYAHAAAHAYVDCALALVGSDRRRAALQLRWRLLDVRERTLDIQAQRDAQDVALDELRQLAEALGEDRYRGQVALRRAARAFQRGDMSTAEKAAREAMESASRADDDDMRLRAQGRLALVLACCGNLQGGRTLAEDGLAQARRVGLPHVQLSLLSHLGYIASLEGNAAATRDLSEQRLTMSRESGDRAAELGALCNCGFDSFEIGDHTGARRYLENALLLARNIGDRYREGYAMKVMSDVVLSQGGEAQEAATLAADALRIAEQTRSKEHQSGALFSIGNAELALGRFNAAAHAFKVAEAMAGEVDDPFRHDATAGRARAALALGDEAAALIFAERTWTSYCEDPKRSGAARPVLIHLTCWQVFDRQGHALATEILESAHASLQNRAGMISDATLRRGFLQNVPEHREIVAAWAGRRSVP